jgi:hypothetical protein
MGGEILDVLTAGVRQPLVEALARLEGVRAVQRVSYEALRLTTTDAGPAIPRVLALLADARVTVHQLQEFRPSFEDVFVRLVGPAADDAP